MLIWNTIEDLTFYVFPYAVYEKYKDLLDAAHNKMLNVDDSNPGLEFVNVAISPLAEMRPWPGYQHPEHYGVLAGYLVSTEQPIECGNVLVLISGFCP
jgi:hypothetical protein